MVKEWWKPVGALLVLLGVMWVVVPGPGGTLVVRDPSDPAKTQKLVVRPAFDVPLKRYGVAVAWSGDSACFAATSFYGGFIDVFDRAGHRIGRQIEGIGGPNVESSLAVLSGCREVLFFPPSSRERTPNVLAFWDVMTGRPNRILQAPDVPNRVDHNWAYNFVLSQDEKKIMTLPTGVKFQALVYDVENLVPSIVPYQKPGASSLAFFPDHTHIALGNDDGSFSIVDLNHDDGRKTYEIPDYHSDLGHVVIGDTAISPDGEMVLVGLNEAYAEYYETDSQGNKHYRTGSTTWENNLTHVKILRVMDGKQVVSFSESGIKRPIRQIQWDPKGHFIAFLDNGGTVYFWSLISPLDSYTKIYLGDKIHSFSISPDGTRIVAVHAETVSVFSIE